jgi:hypothetical protein
MPPVIMVYQVDDGDEAYLFDDLDIALEHIREGVSDAQQHGRDGEEYILTTRYMPKADYDALPEQ